MAGHLAARRHDPIGAALEASGGTALIADAIVSWAHDVRPAIVLAILLVWPL